MGTKLNKWGALTDWSMAPGLQPGPTTCNQAWSELKDVGCGALAADDYLPTNTSFTSSQNISRL